MLLELRDVRRTFGGLAAVDGVMQGVEERALWARFGL